MYRDVKKLGITIQIKARRKPVYSGKRKLAAKGNGSKGRGQAKKRNNSTGKFAYVTVKGGEEEKTQLFSTSAKLCTYLRRKYKIPTNRKIKGFGKTEL